jgi:hypothetical protein
MDPIYNAAYFAHMASCRDAYRRLAECIVEVIPPGDVIDFGCGLGFVIERLHELGRSVLGVDAHATSETVPICRNDLSFPFALERRFTIAICTEVAEHLPWTVSDTLVETVANAADTAIVWSAAPPGQDVDDPGHINLQPPEYWLSRFGARGWSVCVGSTERLRSLMRLREAQHHYAADNFYFLERA